MTDRETFPSVDTPALAVQNAVRLLQAAEDETDRALSELYARLAEVWVYAGNLLNDLER